MNPSVSPYPTTYLLDTSVPFADGIYNHQEITSDTFFTMIQIAGPGIKCRIRSRKVLNYINRRTKLKLKSNIGLVEIKPNIKSNIGLIEIKPNIGCAEINDLDKLLIMRLRNEQPGDPKEKVRGRELDIDQYQFFTCTYLKSALDAEDKFWMNVLCEDVHRSLKSISRFLEITEKVQLTEDEQLYWDNYPLIMDTPVKMPPPLDHLKETCTEALAELEALHEFIKRATITEKRED